MPQTKKFWLRGPGFGLSLEGNIFTFERIKSEIRISKFEYRNSKQILNSNAQLLKIIKKVFIPNDKFVLNIRILVIRVCFVFRISCF
jgi:hypothetical protein